MSSSGAKLSPTVVAAAVTTELEGRSLVELDEDGRVPEDVQPERLTPEGVAAATDERAGRVFTPQQFGAAGDGATADDFGLAAAYAAAVENGGAVVLHGAFRQTEPWVFDGDEIVPVYARGATLVPDASVRSVKFNAGEARTRRLSLLDGALIDGSNGGYGVEIVNHFGAALRHVRIVDSPHGLLVSDESPGVVAAAGWSESSTLDDVVLDNCAVGIDFDTNGGTGSFGYFDWGFVGVYNVPAAGIGVRVQAGSFLYHANIGTLVVQLNGADAIGLDIAGVWGRNSRLHAVIEAGAGVAPTDRVGIKLTSTASVVDLDLLAYFQGSFTEKIRNASNIPFTLRDGAGHKLRGRAAGTADNLMEFGVFGDAVPRMAQRVDRQLYGDGANPLDCAIVRYGPNRIGPDTGDTWHIEGTWNGGRLRLGAYRLWVDGSGNLRIKNGDPSSDTDGTVVGNQA